MCACRDGQRDSRQEREREREGGERDVDNAARRFGKDNMKK